MVFGLNFQENTAGWLVWASEGSRLELKDCERLRKKIVVFVLTKMNTIFSLA